MVDPTYNPAEIEANPEWDLAFFLSELRNDDAPIGWSKYIWTARCLRNHFDITRKPATPASESRESAARLHQEKPKT